MRRLALSMIILSLLLAGLGSCREQVEHTAPAIRDRDSVPVMVSWGVNTLISDSGVIKYRIVTERWEMNQARRPSRWIFDKGLFLEQFDEKFHVQGYILCDTAFYYDQQKLWELRSHVRILTKDGLRFRSNLLYWDETKHILYSHVFSKLITPERTLQGTYFRSDERMTQYYVSNSRGSFTAADFGESTTPADTTNDAHTDSLRQAIRQPAAPVRNQ